MTKIVVGIGKFTAIQMGARINLTCINYQIKKKGKKIHKKFKFCKVVSFSV